MLRGCFGLSSVLGSGFRWSAVRPCGLRSASYLCGRQLGSFRNYTAFSGIQTVQKSSRSAIHGRLLMSTIHRRTFIPGSARDSRQRFQNRRTPQEDLKRNLRWVGGGVFVLGVYYVTHLEYAPVSNRRRLMIVTPQEEQSMAESVYHQLITEHKSRLLPPYHPQVKTIQRVAMDIVRAAGLEHDAQWEVNVIDEPEVNAFVLPNGKIFVYTGILNVAENEDGLATVLGHEIAHQMERHSAEKYSLLKFLFLAEFLMSFVVDTRGLFKTLFFQLGILLPFSRKCESEADYVGLLLMSSACYDPRQAIPFWERMRLVHKGPGAQFLSTHPNPENRIEKIREWLPQALVKYESSECSQHSQWLDPFRDQVGLRPRAIRIAAEGRGF